MPRAGAHNTRLPVSGISPNMAAKLFAGDAYGALEAALHDGVRSLQ